MLREPDGKGGAILYLDSVDMPCLWQGGEGHVRECQECGRWGETQSHHKIPRGRDKRGWDFPGNLIDLCWECHHGLQGPHKCRKRAGQYFLEVKAYLEETLAKDYYTPETLSRVIRLPIKQAYQVAKLIP